MEKALSAVEKKSFKPLEMKEFQTKAGPAFGSLKELLLLIGFTIDDSGEGSLTFSQDSDDGLLLCCTALAEALVGEFECDSSLTPFFVWSFNLGLRLVMEH